MIPAGTPNSPTIGASTTINDLTVHPGAILNLGDIGFTVTGNLDALGLIQGCCGDGVDVRGNVRGNLSEIILTVSAGQVATLNGPVTFGAGTSQVRIDGELVLNGNLLNAGQGTVTTLNGIGLLTMTNPADFVIAGFADFQGGNQTGRLTAGTLQTQSLSQGGTVTTSFFAGGKHRTVLAGPSPSTVVSAVLWNRLEGLRHERGAETLEIELLVVTHIDNDHIVGIIELLKASHPTLKIHDIWFNGRPQLS